MPDALRASGAARPPRPADPWSFLRESPGSCSTAWTWAAPRRRSSRWWSRAATGQRRRLDARRRRRHRSRGARLVHASTPTSTRWALSRCARRSRRARAHAGRPGRLVHAAMLGDAWSGRLHARRHGTAVRQPARGRSPAPVPAAAHRARARLRRTGGRTGSPVTARGSGAAGPRPRSGRDRSPSTRRRLRHDLLLHARRVRVGGRPPVAPRPAQREGRTRTATPASARRPRPRDGVSRGRPTSSRSRTPRPGAPVDADARCPTWTAASGCEPRGGPARTPSRTSAASSAAPTSPFETDRPRLQAGRRSRARRGAGLRPRLVRRRRLSPQHGHDGGPRGRATRCWPSSARASSSATFGLTGFALPTRAQSARSVHEQVGGLRPGRRAARPSSRHAGPARSTALAGRNLASSVAANPVFPELLPAVALRRPADVDPLDSTCCRARASSWDLVGDGSMVARGSGYARLRRGPGLGRRHVRQPHRPRGRLRSPTTGSTATATTGAARTSSTACAAGWARPGSTRAPAARAQPARDRARPALAAHPRARPARSSTAGARRLARRGPGLVAPAPGPLWRPLRGLTLADYVIRGARAGRAASARYGVGYFAPASTSRSSPGNGRAAHEPRRATARTR